MTVREMIRQLVMYPMDSQVLDTEGSPIMYMQFHSRENDDVRLEPKSQIDLHSWLDDFFEQAKEENMNDIAACEELQKYGITIDDLHEYSEEVYKWAMVTEVDW